MIYLDNAATTIHKPQKVIDAVTAAMTSMGNASRGAHEGALSASRMVYETRCKAARLFGCARPDHVVFTCNSTEALNIAIQGAIPEGSHVVTTVMEHNSVLRPLYRMQEMAGIRLDFAGTDPGGALDYSDLERLIRPDTSAIVCTHMSNLTGSSRTAALFPAAEAARSGTWIIPASWR